MPTELPVPIEFRLPEGWRAASPERLGIPDLAFIALYPKPDAGFTANITIDGEYHPDAAPLTEIADISVRRMNEIAESVKVTSRHEIGSFQAPGLTQQLVVQVLTGDVGRHLVQSQVYLALLDLNDPTQRGLIRVALTASVTQHDKVLGDFQNLVRTIRPDVRDMP